MKVSLTQKEYEALMPLIEQRVAQYFVQIRHAVLSPFKDDLRKKKIRLIAIRELLKNAPGTEIEFNEEQVQTLTELLHEILHELPGEIRHSQSVEWRTGLKEEKAKINNLLKKLEKYIPDHAA
ncbi:MAG: hypothetical protein Q9P14_06990 [candidate division KSB1 bacterium]|nr:hypothetical protein [candidate division KSB1 bacterium]MDQ7063435.1 hypothetical protein [candidate division KSB1 bacterium]